MLKIGLPIGFAVFFETSIFAAVTLLMSHFNTVTIASHQAAMNFASLLYIFAAQRVHGFNDSCRV